MTQPAQTDPYSTLQAIFESAVPQDLGDFLVQHGSNSSMLLYNECSKKWEWKYVHHLPGRRTLAMAIGSTNHLILEWINKYYQKHAMLRPPQTMVEVQVDLMMATSLPADEFEELKPRNKFEKALELEEFTSYKHREVRAQLLAMAILYMDRIDAEFEEILFVEHAHTVRLCDRPFKAVVDCVARRKGARGYSILDYKTKGKLGLDLANLQLVGYGIAMNDLIGSPPEGIEQWDFIRKSTPELVVHPFDMTSATRWVRVLLEEVEAFWNGLKHRVFVRNTRSLTCGVDKCEFYQICMDPGTLERERQGAADYHSGTVSGWGVRR